jgi:hypothetical protein
MNKAAARHAPVQALEYALLVANHLACHRRNPGVTPNVDVIVDGVFVLGGDNR